MNRINRRTYLSLLAGGTLAIAGCTSTPGDDERISETDSSVDESPPTDTTDEATAGDAEDAGNSESDEREELDADTSSTESEFAVGESFESGEFTVLVSDVDRTDEIIVESDADVLEAADDSRFAVIDLAVQHTGGDEIIRVDEHVDIELADEAENTYDLADNLEAMGHSLIESRLAPGEVTRGDLVYDVPAETEGLVLTLEPLESVADDQDDNVADDDQDDNVADDDQDETDTKRLVDLETETETDSPEVLEQDIQADLLSFGQGVDVADIEVTVTTLEHGNNLGGFMQSDEGHEIVAMGLLIENSSGRDQELSPEQVRLTDNVGRIHEKAPDALRALEGLDGVVIEDETVHEGKIAYQLEEGTSELYFVFDFAEWGGDERVFWKLR